MAYATADDVEERFRTLDADEKARCAVLLDDAAVIIDQYAPDASQDVKKVVSCRMLMRAIGDGDTAAAPIGASQGTMSALGYSQSWTFGSGSNGELYLSSAEKRMLGVGNRIAFYSPLEDDDD